LAGAGRYRQAYRIMLAGLLVDARGERLTPSHASWKAWAEANNERPGTRKAFAEAMAAHGYPGRQEPRSPQLRWHRFETSRAQHSRL
jgi:hypothetical protein